MAENDPHGKVDPHHKKVLFLILHHVRTKTSSFIAAASGHMSITTMSSSPP